MKCKHCQKEVEQVEGKRPKLFCDNTCRSNFWYALNKKGKPKNKIQDATKPTNVIKPKTQPKSNYTADTTKPFMNDAIKKKLGL